MSFLSFFDISLPTANKLYAWGWKASLFGASITLIGVILLMWSTRVRDHDFESQIGQLNVSASKANERTAILEKSNLELQTILERERIARLKLEAQIAPRSLASSQHDALVKALTAVSQPFIISITLIGDREAEMYGKQVVSSLQEANAQVQINHIGIISPPRYGIQITLQANSTKSLSFKNAFEQANIPIIYSFGDTGKFDAIIFIGLKPIK